jgi:amino acid permease
MVFFCFISVDSKQEKRQMTIQHIAILIICTVVFTSGYETTYSDTTSNAANYNNTTNNATNITGKYESSAGVQVVNNNNNG